MNNAKFSVAMCVYGGDRPDWFREAVESILNQTRKPDEVVLVVDGPVPAMLDSVITEYEAIPIFRVIRLPHNEGLGNALRIAVENCTYELIARMDSDDIAVPTRFAEQLAYFRNYPQIDVVGGDISEFIDTEDNIIAKRTVPQEHDEIITYMKTRCALNHVTVMYKKSAVQNVGGYLDWFCNEDYYLWIRMMKDMCIFSNTGTVLVNVRVGEDMYQRRGGVKYFRSEAKLQKYMLQQKMIGFGTYLINVGKRLVVQVLLPNRIRSWVFQKFARKAVKV